MPGGKITIMPGEATGTTSQWTPYREPLGVTLARTGAIALVIGAVLAASSRGIGGGGIGGGGGGGGGGGLARWAMASLLALWPALGGHFIELWFLNWLRPRLPSARAPHVVARVLTWFVGGGLFAACMRLTALALAGGATAARPMRPTWWVAAGFVYIGIELVAHLILHWRGRPSFYNGRG